LPYREHQQEFLAAVTAELSVLRNVREYVMANVLSTSSPVGWAVGVVDALNQSRSISRSARRLAAMGAGDLSSNPHDVATIEGAVSSSSSASSSMRL